MRLFILIFFLGIVVILCLSHLPNVFDIFGFSVFIAVCFGGCFFVKNIFINNFLKLIIIFCVGSLWAVLHGYIFISERLPQEIFYKDLWVQGQIISLPKKGHYQDSFLFYIKKILYHPEISHCAIIDLHAENKRNSLKIGDDWQFKVKLHAVHGLANPGGFDAERLFFIERIQAIGSVEKSLENRLLNASIYHRPVDRLRQFIQNLLQNALSHQPLAGIIIAIVMGNTSDISAEQWEVFRRTGTNHLVAISGLHIALVSSFLYALVNVLWRRIPYLCLRLPANYAAFIQALIGGIIYSALAGFSVSTMRAVIMIMVMMSFSLLGRNPLPCYNLLIALFLVLLMDPLMILSASFWLSFGAVVIIFYGVGGRVGKQRSGWWRIGRVQWIITVCMLPLSLFIFQQVSLVSFVANIIAIPWVEFIVVPLSLGGTLLALMHLKLGIWLLLLAEQAMGFIWRFLHYLSLLDNFNWQHAISKLWVFFVSIIGVLLLTAPRGLPARYLGFIGLLPLLCNQSSTPKLGEAWFTLLDVGQGLSAVLQTKNHTLVFDAGLKLNDTMDMGKRVVLPFLRASGIDHINRLIISHGDNDHAGGSEALVKQIKVDELFTSVPEKFRESRFFKNISIQHCYQGQAWQWDGVYFQFLNPPNPSYTGPAYTRKIENNNSCVLRITVGKKNILIPGDIEKPAEYYLIHNTPNALQADILVAPHHGSRSSSSPIFVYLVKPRYVLFPLGYHNHYHFPHPLVVKRYREIGAVMLDTASQGAITFKLNAQGEGEPISYRLDHKHFWNVVLPDVIQ